MMLREFARFLIVLVSNFPMGVTGFGDAIIMHIALTLCGLTFTDVCDSAISEAVFNLTIGGLAAMGVQSYLIWQDTNWKLVRLLLPPILFGTGLGLVLLYHIHSMWLKRVLGLIFLSVACYQTHGEILRAKGLIPPPSRTGPLEVSSDTKSINYLGLSLGAASGILAGLFGTGGPPLMIFVAVFEIDKDEWRASNAVIWFVDNIFRFFYIYLIQGQISLPDDVPQLAMLLVAGGLGVYAGSSVSTQVDMILFRRLLILLLLLGANVMLFAGAPGRLAMGGVLCVLLGVILYVLAIWNQPMQPFSSKLGTANGIGSAVRKRIRKRWFGGSTFYRQVSTTDADNEEEEDDDEQDEELLLGRKNEGEKANDEGRKEIELTDVASN